MKIHVIEIREDEKHEWSFEAVADSEEAADLYIAEDKIYNKEFFGENEPDFDYRITPYELVTLNSYKRLPVYNAWYDPYAVPATLYIGEDYIYPPLLDSTKSNSELTHCSFCLADPPYTEAENPDWCECGCARIHARSTDRETAISLVRIELRKHGLELIS